MGYVQGHHVLEAGNCLERILVRLTEALSGPHKVLKVQAEFNIRAFMTVCPMLAVSEKNLSKHPVIFLVVTPSR